MERKHHRMSEGSLIVFSLPRNLKKVDLIHALDMSLSETKTGRVLGSAISLAADGAICVEIGAHDSDSANAAIADALAQLRCDDYEFVWD